MGKYVAEIFLQVGSPFYNFTRYLITPAHKTIAMCCSSNIQLKYYYYFWRPPFNVYFKIRFILTRTPHYICFKLIIFSLMNVLCEDIRVCRKNHWCASTQGRSNTENFEIMSKRLNNLKEPT